MAQCRYSKRDKTPCGGVAVGPSGGCYAHDPAYELDRKRDARKNGKRGGRGRPNPGTADLARLQLWFERLAKDVEEGRADRADGAVVGQLLNGARACIAASAKVRELEEVEARITALERARKDIV